MLPSSLITGGLHLEHGRRAGSRRIGSSASPAAKETWRKIERPIAVLYEVCHEISASSRVNSKIAREAGRLHWWREKLWGRRYRGIVVSEESEAEVERLRYLFSQGCKEGLVDSPKQWPGATSATAHTTGWKLPGLWFDRTAEYKARRRGELVPKLRFAEGLQLEITRSPAGATSPSTDSTPRCGP